MAGLMRLAKYLAFERVSGCIDVEVPQSRYTIAITRGLQCPSGGR